MLISFSVENWRCFRNPTTLNMIAGREKQHRERLPYLKSFNTRLLPISAIYGANASGKTKFVEALSFLQHLVVQGTSPEGSIAVERFKLASDYRNRPTKLSIDLLIDDAVYSYEACLLPESVLEESLVIETSSKAYDVFSRTGKNIKFDNSFFTKDRLDFVKLVAQAARDNQLFLTTAVQLGVQEFSPLYKWFSEKLTIIGPASEYLSIHRFADPTDNLSSHINELVRKLGTGIDHFEARELKTPASDNATSMSLNLLDLINSRLPKNAANHFRLGDIYISKENGEKTVKQLMAIHKNSGNEDIAFSLMEESDGTRRLLDLIPAFLELQNQIGKVYVVDELDRSLHTKLLEWLLEYYLESCNPEARSQLIFTTHDVNLLTQNIFRRDELWGTDKNSSGVAELYSFRDFGAIRSDKDIRKIYLNGLVGAVPSID